MGSIERAPRGATPGSASARIARTSVGISSDGQREVARTPTRGETKKPPRRERGGWKGFIVKRLSVLGRPGSDLLFQVLRLSTIGAGKFNGRVRDGIGY